MSEIIENEKKNSNEVKASESHFDDEGHKEKNKCNKHQSSNPKNGRRKK